MLRLLRNSSHEQINNNRSLTISQRIILIFSIVILFWIVFVIIYLLTRVIIRFLSNVKLPSETKVCQVYVIPSRSIETIYRSNNVTPNHHGTLREQSKAGLLEHYLRTYNPLEIDLINTNQPTISASNVKDEEMPSETDTHTIDNCYLLNCTNKQTHQYVRLKEKENSSAAISLTDNRLSECSTRLTTMILPIVMVTDCSDNKRLHTDIIEMNDDE